MGLSFRDPFSKIPIKIKLPLGFILLYLIVVGGVGYFVINSVYAPLSQEIFRRVQSESLTLATLFDTRLEALARRAEDFSSDGFIRTQTEALVRAAASLSGDPETTRASESLRWHLRINKLPIIPEMIDLQVYDLSRRQLLNIRTPAPDIHRLIAPAFDPERQRISAFIPPNAVDDVPAAAIVTPLFNIQRDEHIGYLVCVFDLTAMIERALMTYDSAIPASHTEKYITFADRNGIRVEVPWWVPDDEGARADAWHVRVFSGVRPAAASSRWSGGTQAGQEIFAEHYTLRNADWDMTVELNATQAMNPLFTLEGKLLGVATIVALTTLVILLFPVKYLIRPLGELQRMADRIKEGDFSARNQIESGDEIGALARTANLMAEAIQERTRSLERTAANLQKSERELRVQHNLMNTVIHAMTDGLVLMNFQGKILLSNRAAEPLIDIIQRQNGHMRISKCEYHKADNTACVSCICDPNRVTSCVLTVDNAIYEVLSTKVPTLHGSSKVLVARNITEREHMHRQQAHQERLTVLGKLAAVVAHEMNNPLAAISMYNQMMESELAGSSPFREHVEVIRRNTQTCQRIIKELLDYARTPQPRLEEIDIHALLDGIIRFLHPLHKKDPVEIEKDFRAQNAVCWGDAAQLQQVFVNLIVNAIQAIHHDKGRVRILTADAQDRVVVEVEDNGMGIDAKYTQEIFEPFFTTKRSGGTGLGLPTAKRLINAHGGELTLLESRPGRTVFRVTIGNQRIKRD